MPKNTVHTQEKPWIITHNCNIPRELILFNAIKIHEARTTRNKLVAFDTKTLNRECRKRLHRRLQYMHNHKTTIKRSINNTLAARNAVLPPMVNGCLVHIPPSGMAYTWNKKIQGHSILNLSQKICLRYESLEISQIIDERSSSPDIRKTISVPQTGIEPATFWWPVSRFNHWATETQMASLGATSIYVLSKQQPRYMDNGI